MLCLSKWVHEPGPSSMMPTILGRRIVVLNTLTLIPSASPALPVRGLTG